MRVHAIGLLFVGTLVGLRICLALPRCRTAAGRIGRRALAWLVLHLERPSETDELAEEMRQVVRRERLRADLRRVRGLLATDTAMSACRQIGNRIAYASLVDELERHVRDFPWLLASAVDSPVSSADTSYPTSGPYRARSPQVEVLDLGWRH